MITTQPSSFSQRFAALPLSIKGIFILSVIQLVVQWGLWVGYAFGVATGVLSIIVAIMGMVGASKKNKNVILAYMFSVGILTILFMVFGVVQVMVTFLSTNCYSLSECQSLNSQAKYLDPALPRPGYYTKVKGGCFGCQTGCFCLDGESSTLLDNYECYDVTYICSDSGRIRLKVSTAFFFLNFIVSCTGCILSCIAICGDSFIAAPAPAAGRHSSSGQSTAILFTTPGFTGKRGYPPLTHRTYVTLPSGVTPDIAGKFDESVDRYRKEVPLLLPGEIRPLYEDPDSTDEYSNDERMGMDEQGLLRHDVSGRHQETTDDKEMVEMGTEKQDWYSMEMNPLKS